ncbi:MAG: UDP-N-acetylmuramoyl-tripeptide--D-alanyl-D-alanine ligase [Bacteroidales bacterium]|nr:UDP-N-acetylmuramoyl-tripeptide--D-alanyl-D-alanine ligase [Bacteroidales bacterium]
MENILIIIFMAVAAVWVCVKLGYELQMFQQNSYRNERYFKWLGKNYASIDRLVELAALVVIAIIWFTGINKLWLILPSLMYVMLTIKTLTRKSKVKLKFTSRAKRLYFTSLAIIVIAVVLHIILNSLMAGYLTAAADGVLTCVILPIANIILRPVENHINNWYINDAKRILNEHKDLIIIGITGSYGKTSTKHFLETILSQKYNVLMTPGSFNTTMGVVRTIREYLKPTHEVFICEMGAKQIGDIKEICDLVHPKYGILTSVAEQHLDTFHNIENVRKTKFELIDSLPEDGCAFLNADYEIIKNTNHGKKAEYYSTTDNTANYFVNMQELAYSQDGTDFGVVVGGSNDAVKMRTPLLGDYNISNILACVACACKLGLTMDQISFGVHKLRPVEHRMEIKRNAAGVVIIDDAFNSNPKGAKMALETLAGFPGQRFVITPGIIELGDKQYFYNEQLGEQIADCVDFAVLVGQKQTAPIHDGLLKKSFPADKIYVAQNLNDAATWTFARTNAGDVVLFENDLPDLF